MRRLAPAVVLLAALVGPGVARAGRSSFGWLYDTEVVPERSVELETWVFEEDHLGSPAQSSTNLWWGAVVGITDQLELALPVELAWVDPGDAAPGSNLERFGAELRWRLVSSDPVDAPPIAPLLRLGVKRPIGERGTIQLEPDFVLSADLAPARVAVDLGGVIRTSRDQVELELRPSLGASFALGDELRLGGEVYGELGVGDARTRDWLGLGPDLAWSHGRFWLAGAYLVGLSGLDVAPRLNWGIAF